MEDDASRARSYRDKAEELRRMASEMSTKEAKKSFIQMADDYLRMASLIDHGPTQKSDS